MFNRRRSTYRVRPSIVLLIVSFVVGYFFGSSNAVKDSNSVSRSTLDTEVANAQKSSYDAGYTEGRKAGLDEGYKSGYTQGTEYGKSLILDQIDIRVQEAERTNKNTPLFKVKQ